MQLYAVSDSGAVSFRQNLIRSQNDLTSASRTLQYDPQIEPRHLSGAQIRRLRRACAGFSGAILSASHISMDKGITRTGFRVGKSGTRGSIVAMVRPSKISEERCQVEILIFSTGPTREITPPSQFSHRASHDANFRCCQQR